MRTVFTDEMRKDCGVEGQGGKTNPPEYLVLNAVVRCPDPFSWCKAVSVLQIKC